MNTIITFFETMTPGHLFAMFAAFLMLTGARAARRTRPQMTAEQAEQAEAVREEFHGAAPIAIVTSVGVVVVWQMAIR